MGVSKTSQVCPRLEEWKMRATLPPVANQMLWSGPSGAETRLISDDWPARVEVALFPVVLPGDITRVSVSRARQELLAANAPSPSIASGSCDGAIGFQDSPSSVCNSSNFSFPCSSVIGSPNTMPCLESQNAIESKNPLGFELVNCSCQCLPASAV